MPTPSAKSEKRYSLCPSAHGGDYFTTRKARARARPLSTRHSMHLVLRASVAKGPMSFRRRPNQIREILYKFAHKNKIRIHLLSVNANHLHLQIQLTHTALYKKFIRAITASIAMRVSGRSRWRKVEGKFWDARPFTRLAFGQKAFTTLNDYIKVNRYESWGASRTEARRQVQWERAVIEDNKRIDWG